MRITPTPRVLPRSNNGVGQPLVSSEKRTNSAARLPVRSRSGPPDDELDLRGHLAILLEHRRFIALIVLLTLIGGALYVAVATPIYRANAVIQIEQKSGGLGELDKLASVLSGQATTQSEVEILRSRTLLGRVIDDLGLEVSAEPRRFPFVGAAIARALPGPGLVDPPVSATSHFAWGGESIRVDRMSVPPELEDARLLLVAGEAGGYSVYGPDSRLLLSGRVGAPTEARTESPSSVELLVSELRARPGTHFWVRKRSRLEVVDELQRALRLVDKGSDTGGFITVSLDGEDPTRTEATLESLARHYVGYQLQRRSEEIDSRLAFLEAQLPGLRAELDRAERALSIHRTRHGGADLGMEAQAIIDRSFELEKSLSALTLEQLELRQRFTENHPAVAAVTRKLAQLNADRAALNAQLRGLPYAEFTSAQLLRDVNIAKEMYLNLKNKAQEYRVLKGSTVSQVRVLDEPVLSSQPVRPNKPGVLGVSLALGLTLGIALAFTRQAFRSGVLSPSALEARLGVPVSAAIPLSSGRLPRSSAKHNPERAIRSILANSHPRDLTVECLRSLRTHVQLAVKDSPNNAIAITGPSPGVGKSFVSVNLAWLLADAGKRTLLIDGNLRRGSLHHFFGAGRGPGLSELLEGTVEFERALLHPAPGLSFLATGALPPNPAELLLSDRLTQLVARASAEYEFVLIDTPPILAVTDATLIGSHAGVNLAVVRAGAHPIREVAAAVRRLQDDGVRLHGVILNAVSRSRAGRAMSGIYQYEYPSQAEHRSPAEVEPPWALRSNELKTNGRAVAPEMEEESPTAASQIDSNAGA